MIEKEIILQKMKENEVKEFVLEFLGKLSCSHVEIQRTPLGEKIIVYTAKPGLIVGRKGGNIKTLTEMLKTKYKMENPQIEVAEIPNQELDAPTVAKNIVATFERFGPKRFKAIAYKFLENTMAAGALGAEIVVSGRGVPGERAKSWRFSAGYLKKSGEVSENYVDKAREMCHLMSGAVGIKVSILRPDVKLPDTIKIKLEKEPEEKEKIAIETEPSVKPVPSEEEKEEKKKGSKPKKKTKEKIKKEKTKIKKKKKR